MKQAGKDLKKMDDGQQVALLEAFGRVSRGTQKRDEDEDLPIAKNKKLRAVRKSYRGSSLRLIYARVTVVTSEDEGEILDPDSGFERSAELIAADRNSAIHLGLLAWSKKRNDMPTDVGEAAWDRLQGWLRDNPSLEQC